MFHRRCSPMLLVSSVAYDNRESNVIKGQALLSADSLGPVILCVEDDPKGRLVCTEFSVNFWMEQSDG